MSDTNIKYIFLKRQPKEIVVPMYDFFWVGHMSQMFKKNFNIYFLAGILESFPSEYHQEIIRELHAMITERLSSGGFEEMMSIYQEQDNYLNKKLQMLPDIFLFLRSDLGQKLFFCQEFLKTFPTSKDFVDAWISEEEQQFPKIFDNWIQSMGPQVFKLLPLLEHFPKVLDTIVKALQIPGEFVDNHRLMESYLLKMLCLHGLEKDLSVERDSPKSLSLGRLFKVKQENRFDESLRPDYLQLLKALMSTFQPEQITTILVDFHKNHPDFLNKKFGDMLPESLQKRLNEEASGPKKL